MLLPPTRMGGLPRRAWGDRLANPCQLLAWGLGFVRRASSMCRAHLDHEISQYHSGIRLSFYLVLAQVNFDLPLEKGTENDPAVFQALPSVSLGNPSGSRNSLQCHPARVSKSAQSLNESDRIFSCCSSPWRMHVCGGFTWGSIKLKLPSPAPSPPPS
ncbi:hypothetical protein B0I37DRAFT_97816 [Chaetomium sp. MPI-CAGE-AT-0009]|nr:hypothetical protein B0I37DRAFT_97816 [Chaetomium sp. MPI-CAGE-AT-0009]